VTLTRPPAFAAIGHLESWDHIAAVYRAMRPATLAPVTDAVLRETVPWIPPRPVTRFQVAAAPAAVPVSGVYIDTFITPDDLALAPTRRLVARVHDAIKAAEREGARVATLGGFTSILLEAMPQPPVGNLVLTTGNTLTAALIGRGIERAARLLGRPLECETLLIIGATGDVGSACARWFAGRTRRLFLAARNRQRLEDEGIRLRRHGPVEASTDVAALLKDATLVIAAASTPAPLFSLAACHPEAVICDAGYPKNIRFAPADVQRQRVFWGGMGVVGGGLWSDDGILEAFYRFPSPHTAHGCMLEGAVLAVAERWEPFSTGRGQITPERIDEMARLSCASGIALAPLFDAAGLWPEEASAR
jgi:predicted amino acid dehydrogenase